LNYRLVRKGLAQACPLPQCVIYESVSKRLLKAQNRAVYWKRGLWKNRGKADAAATRGNLH